MAEKRDYYEVLLVERKSTKVEIDRAYRKLAIKYHPDSNRNDTDAVTKFKEASEAYEVLSDTEKRGRYDQFGHAGVNAQAGGPQFTDFDAFGDICTHEHRSRLQKQADFDGTGTHLPSLALRSASIAWSTGTLKRPLRLPSPRPTIQSSS